MRAVSSSWDALEPQAQWLARVSDPVCAQEQIKADKALLAAMRVYPLDKAALQGALKAGACPDRVVHGGFPALHVAVSVKDAQATALLLRYGARTDDVDADGETAQTIARRIGFSKGAEMLKQAAAEAAEPDAQEEDNSYTARINAVLRRAVEKGTAASVAQAIELGGDANMTAGSGRFPLLQTAVAALDVEKTNILLKAGADVFAKSAQGTDACDALWFSRAPFSSAWNDVLDALHAHGYARLFLKPPHDLTPDDLRHNVPTGAQQAPTVMQYLVENGQADFVLDVLKAHPEQGLTGGELTQKSPWFANRSLLESFHAAKKLDDVFNAAVWQGRGAEAMTLKPAVEKDFFMKGKVDFDKLAEELRALNLKTLRQKTQGKLRLKPRPPAP